jgi:hypothetical protein
MNGKKNNKESLSAATINFIYAEGADGDAIKKLRDLFDTARNNPDEYVYSNFKIEWERVLVPKDGIKFVWSDTYNVSADDINWLKKEISKALENPDYFVITNFKVHFDFDLNFKKMDLK